MNTNKNTNTNTTANMNTNKNANLPSPPFCRLTHCGREREAVYWRSTLWEGKGLAPLIFWWRKIPTVPLIGHSRSTLWEGHNGSTASLILTRSGDHNHMRNSNEQACAQTGLTTYNMGRDHHLQYLLFSSYWEARKQLEYQLYLWFFPHFVKSLDTLKWKVCV